MAVGDVPEPRVVASLKQAWTNIWPHFWWLLLFGAISGLASNIQAGQDFPTAEGPRIFVNLVGSLVAIFLGIPLGIGLVKAHLAASRGQKPTWSDLGYAFGKRYWPSIGLGMLWFLIVVGGLLLLIVPGIYWAIRLSFTSQRFVEDTLGPIEAIKASFADTKGRWWSVFGLAVISIPIIIAGLLALIVGVFVAAVLISQMNAVYWRAVDQASREDSTRT